MSVQYLAELVAYDLVGATTVTLRYCTGRGFVTAPSETPANTEYAPRLVQPLAVSRYAFAPGATAGRSVLGLGDLVLSNLDGALDALATDYAFDGRSLVIRRGTEGAAYPAGFPVVFTGTMEQVEVARERVVVRARDRAAELEVALQSTLYAGDNVLPDGLEGTADDLKGQPKPLAFGKVTNATLPCVNTSKLIYQLNDGTVQSLDAVFDAGIPLGFLTTWGDSDTAGYMTADQALCIVYGDSVVVVGNTGGYLYYSANGVDGTWSTGTHTLSGAITALATDGTTLAAGSISPNNFAYSTDGGGTWTNNGTGSGQTVRCIHYSARLGLWIAAGDNGTLYTATTPGGTWTSRTSGFSTTRITAIAESGTTLVAVGYAGKISTSTNGTAWTARNSSITSNFATNLLGVAWGETAFRIGGAAGIVLWADADGAVWSREPVTMDGLAGGTSYDIYAPFYWEGVWYLFGQSYNYLSSVGESHLYAQHYDTNAPLFAVCANGDGRVVGARGSNGAGISDIGGTYASLADLEDDTLQPGYGDFKWISHADGSYVRLGSTPYGTVTADVTVGATAADRTVAQLFADVLTKAGYTSADWVAGDLTTLDAADNAEVGYWTGTEPVSVAAVLDALANTVGAWWGPRASDGDFRIVQLLAPTGTPALTITANDLIGALTMLPPTDDGRGLPSYRTTLRHSPNWTVQTSGLADGVTAARRAFLAAPWREASDEDTAVQTAYLLALATTEETLYTVESDAIAEATRRQALRGVRRRRFDCVVPLSDDADFDTMALDIGDVVTLEHPRFGLSAGVDFRVLGVEPNARAGTVRLLLWGS